MKVVRFEEEVEKLGLSYQEYVSRCAIEDCYEEPIALVDSVRPYIFSTDFDSFVDLQDIDPEKAAKVFGLCVELARTPIDERKSEIKYYLKHKWLGREYGEGFLNYIDPDDYTLSSSLEIGDFKTKFTEEEIYKLRNELDTRLEDFEWVEAE